MRSTTFIYILAATFVISACSKDKFDTRPTIEIKDYNTKTVTLPDETLTIRLNYTDKEGDLGTGTVFAARLRQNRRPLSPADANIIDTFYFALPEFTDRVNGEISVNFTRNTLKESISENDTMVFRLAVTDRGGHTSDTLTTDQIVAVK